ncbi:MULTISPECIES: hypothetical protein [unclassified Nodularia (in: cyanobacteria)]|uniref:hypothetical protein n=1 Tax=unclassified Nodularia (in: cyanobacteria) TaxID=2656917 RepID=UPI00187F2401|nr:MULTISPECIES: hypothetical protein [unclassified Nodularia (in: cyanobacteria)]MBE9200126.1 hypothetical protein [Nodularia sp. LEGE 06071]MCC2693984.1 hypothetical protein [Nodularia sp. LEGE 04288]
MFSTSPTKLVICPGLVEEYMCCRNGDLSQLSNLTITDYKFILINRAFLTTSVEL